MKIKTGDNVKILSGKDKGKTGKVIQVLFNAKKQQYFVVVEGTNILKKHLRSGKRGEKGQILELSAPINISNVMLIESKTKKTTRISYSIEGKEKKRISQKTKELID